MAENLEQLTVQIPREQARWMRAKAELHGCSVSEVARKAFFTAIQVEALASAPPSGIMYVTAPAPSEVPA